MTLDPNYIEYPKRRLGYDHDLYAFSTLPSRKPLAWPDGKSVAAWIVVSLEWFPITPGDTPFRAPGHMQTAYPDYRHYTAREYGTRVGFYRLLDAFAKAGVKASIAANGAIAQRYPSIIRDVVDAGHEIIAHSTDMNGTIASSLPVDAERALIHDSIAALSDVAGVAPRGWHSIARSQSFATPDLLMEAGIEYCCDWANDEVPWTFTNGLVNLPLNHELSDRQILNVQQQSVDSYATQILDAHDWLSAEAQTQGARLLPLHLTPYIIGLPYRMDAFERLLADLAARPQTWFARGSDILDSFRSQM
ncbi:polysaccharide deacetylase family protein [Novosphingobium sp. ST904]|uniref:polysaccharide deacetylase family protein n=1 Tax=Novosphingobium sp. ST904 TaxID=1684385 RepID=UPI0006C87855|nr:polysaccharide deacetylase family protein [Novosphingobium sp. ST904]KPH66229.1 polysaccharide deacetylase [Novosphingobium sp. ST904]TCM38835.1 polysaccharide deacetylase [Novosphingobium sp. ST904]